MSRFQGIGLKYNIHFHMPTCTVSYNFTMVLKCGQVIFPSQFRFWLFLVSQKQVTPYPDVVLVSIIFLNTEI